MAHSANAPKVTEKPGKIGEFLVKSGAVIYDQSLVGTVGVTLTASNTAVEPFDGGVTNMAFLGVARLRPKNLAESSQDSITGVSVAVAAVGDGKTIEVDMSGVILERVTVTGIGSPVEVGRLVYNQGGTSLGDPANFTANNVSSSADAIGWVTKVHADAKCDVKLFTPGEFRATASD